MLPLINQVPSEHPPPKIVERNQVQNGHKVVYVPKNQNVDQVLRNVQHNNLVGQNNITNMVEQNLASNGLNVGMHRPNYKSPLLEYARQNEFPRGWKSPNLLSSLVRLTS